MVDKRKNAGKDMDEVDVNSRGNKVRPSDLIEIYTIPDKWARLRYHGPIFSYGIHWVKTKTKEGKVTKFPAVCTAFDPQTGKRDQTKPCPWCEHEDNDQVQFGVEYWSNVLVRSLQRQKPSDPIRPTKQEVKLGFKDKDSETWTPNRGTRLTGGLLRQLKELKPLNVHEVDGDSMPFAVSHIKYGCDVMVKYDKDAAQASRYSVQKSDPKPLTKEERSFLPYDLSELHVVPTLEEAKAEYKSWLERMSGKKSKKSSDDDDDEDETPKKSSKKKVVDDDDEDEDEAPKKSSKKKVLDDDDDEDDSPPKKSAKKPAKKVVDDDDEDEDDDLDEDEDEEDDPPPKKSSKKKVVDDDDDEDDNEDDDPPPKKSTKKPVKKVAKKVVEEDDDEDEDDDDEDDDPPPKKSSKKKVVDDDDDEDDEPPPKKSVKKKKVVDDDDE